MTKAEVEALEEYCNTAKPSDHLRGPWFNIYISDVPRLAEMLKRAMEHLEDAHMDCLMCSLSEGNEYKQAEPSPCKNAALIREYRGEGEKRDER